jgi:hypothetical protein
MDIMVLYLEWLAECGRLQEIVKNITVVFVIKITSVLDDLVANRRIKNLRNRTGGRGIYSPGSVWGQISRAYKHNTLVPGFEKKIRGCFCRA